MRKPTMATIHQMMSRSTMVIGVILGVLVSACGTGAPAPATSHSSLYNFLPQDVRASGKIVLVSAASNGPPWIFQPSGNGQFDGIDPDLARAMSRQLGVAVEFATTEPAGVVPALIAGRYDLAMQGMFITKAREQQIDMISYISDASTIVVSEGNSNHVATLNDLCGRTVAVPTGSNQEKVATDFQGKCGGRPMHIQHFPTKPDCYLQVRSGRAVATIDGVAVTKYLKAHHVAGFDGLEALQNLRLAPAQLGIGVPKSKAQLRDALAAAMNAIMRDGTYQKILDKWGIAGGAISEAAVNP